MLTVREIIDRNGEGVYHSLFSLGLAVTDDSHVFFVDSGHTNALDALDEVHGYQWQYPFATLDYAVTQCTADNGDVILVAPGHAETESTANGEIVDVDVNGVTIIGLGVGNQRPTFTLGVATATFKIAANDILMRNIIIASDIADLTTALELGASSDNITLEDIEFKDGGASKEIGICISAGATVTDLTVRRCVYKTTAAAGDVTSFLKSAATSTDWLIEDCLVMGSFDSPILDLDAAAITNSLVIRRNLFANDDVDVGAGGVIMLAGNQLDCVLADNRLVTGDGDAVPIAVGTGSNQVASLADYAAEYDDDGTYGIVTGFGSASDFS